ncbi:MAG: DinB family protein [Dehalococcoidia bacterium]|nr:DinB family protein [Dehalococcoidia bacterium]MYD28465.1 DinB family protein [Dehalococcoidia bacterium]
MDARDLLRAQFAWVHQLLEGTMSDCSQETADHRDEGWAISPISAIYAHVGMTQDGIVHGLVQGRPTLLESEGWDAKLGLEAAGPRDASSWADKRFDLATVRDYLAAVQAATDAFLADAEDEVLQRSMETPMGEQRVIDMLANVGVVHVASHWGEIAALRGVQGEKGLPF